MNPAAYPATGLASACSTKLVTNPPATHPKVAPTRTSGYNRSPWERWVSDIVVNTPQEGPENKAYNPNSDTNHMGCNPALKHAKAPVSNTEQIMETPTNKRFADIR